MTAQKFYKRGTITAEQFDGSDEMAERFLPGSEKHSDTRWVQNHFDEEGNFIYQNELTLGDWLVMPGDLQHLVSDEAFRMAYAAIPVIPEAASEWIERAKQQGMSLMLAFIGPDDDLNTNGADASPLSWWIHDHSEDFGRAWLDGYQIEEEMK